MMMDKTERKIMVNIEGIVHDCVRTPEGKMHFGLVDGNRYTFFDEASSHNERLRDGQVVFGEGIKVPERDPDGNMFVRITRLEAYVHSKNGERGMDLVCDYLGLYDTYY